MGENPFLSDPNVNKVRKALSALEFLVVQDIFLTETAEFADVVLPASSYMEKDGTYTNTDRRVQIGRKVLEPGEARDDWKVLCDLATRIGLPMDYASPSEVFDELAALMPNYAGLSYDNLGATGKLYPNPDPEHSDGKVVLFDERFGTDDGKAHLVPAEWLPAKELPDDEFPFILNTGRLLEHWHTGSMTRRSYALDTIQPEAHVFLNPDDAAAMGVGDGDFVRVTAARGSIELVRGRVAPDTPGTCFIPFHFREAAANVLTIDEIDPIGKIPEFKFCAVRVEPADASGPRRRGPSRALPGPSRNPSLHEIQREHGWLLREELVTLSRERRRPLYEIEGLISFYPHFRTEPPPRRRSPAATTCPAGCTARTSASPSAGLIPSASSSARSRASAAATTRRPPRATRPGRAAGDGAAPERPVRPDTRDYRVLRAALEARRGAHLDAQGLGAARHGRRGLPDRHEVGAGREAGGEPKYAICNADESEPGTFKDRQILAEQPHPRARGPRPRDAGTGCREGWVFIRHEYELEEEVLREELERLRPGPARRGGWAGVDIFTSPGGYILGEESALIECMEGHRGEPRNKPPFPGVAGCGASRR